MTYEMYAYRPETGVAVCLRGSQWLFVEFFHEEKEAVLIGRDESIRLADRLGMQDMARRFGSFTEITSFLANEYKSSRAAQGISDLEYSSAVDVIELLDESAILELIEELRSEGQHLTSPRQVIGLLESISNHSKFMATASVLVPINLLRLDCKHNLGPSVEDYNQESLSDLIEGEERLPLLNGNSLKYRRMMRRRKINLSAA